MRGGWEIEILEGTGTESFTRSEIFTRATGREASIEQS